MSTSKTWQVEPLNDKTLLVCKQGTGIPGPENWKQRLIELLHISPTTVCVGAKRVTADGKHIFSMGEVLIHPKGFHHLGQGVDSHCYRFPEEIDCIASGVMAVRRQAFEEINATQILENSKSKTGAIGGELAAVELGLALRKNGGRCFCAPQVVVADVCSPQPTRQEEEEFEKRWGFHWQAPDLDLVKEKHQGTGLFWNLRFHAGTMPFDRYEYRPAPVWKSYQDADYFRQRAHFLAQTAKKLCTGGPLVEVGCGDGLFSHLIAMMGVEVIGIDPETLGIEQAKEKTKSLQYPGPRPVFKVGHGAALEFEEKTLGAVVLFDVIEHLPNPVKVLNEASRVLKPAGHLFVVTPGWQYGGWSDPVYHGHEYTMEELVRQISSIRGLKIVDTGRIGGVYRDVMVMAKKEE